MFQNNPISFTEHQEIFKICALFAIIIVLAAVMHITRAALDGAKQIVLRSVSLNRVNIVKKNKNSWFYEVSCKSNIDGFHVTYWF